MKRRNCSSRAIYPFLTVFSKDLYCRQIKTRVFFLEKVIKRWHRFKIRLHVVCSLILIYAVRQIRSFRPWRRKGRCLVVSMSPSLTAHSVASQAWEQEVVGSNGKYSFRGLMTVIATTFILLSSLSIVSKMVMWESSQPLGKNILWSTV